MRTLITSCFLSLVHALVSRAEAVINGECPSDGMCEQGNDDSSYLICASQRWQQMSANGYSCISGSLVPSVTVTTQASLSSPPCGLTASSKSTVLYQDTNPVLSTSPSYNAPADDNLYATRQIATPSLSSADAQATSSCLPCIPVDDDFGTKSCTPNGKMASVYDTNSDSVFRCDGVDYPADGMYVAFWTRFQESQASQPAPVNCGQTLEFTNPLTKKSATALVLDRFASCVGVGNQLNDPTTDQCLANGATVDFSRALWNEIYDGAPDNVYDVMYEGKPLLGMP